MKHRLIAGLIAFILPFHMLALADSGWDYKDGVLTINSNTHDYVKDANKPWDKYKNDIEKIVIGDGVTSIGDWSFSNLNNLKEVEFASSVDVVGERAFYNCSSISYINLNDGLKTIENGAFNGCKGVIRINLPSGLESVGDSAFMNLPKVPVLTIPASVNEIGMWAFMGCTSLEQIYFEGKLPQNMGNFCFTDVHDNHMIYYNIEFGEDWKEFSEFNSRHTLGYSPDERIPVYLNNREICFEVDPIIVNGRTLVPMRDVFEALGADVSWDGQTETASAQKDGTTVYVQIGSDTIRKNNQIISVDAPARIHLNRTLVPVRAISEALDALVKWDSEIK